MKKEHTCQRCGKQHLSEFTWLELNTYTNRYHRPEKLPIAGLSQGLFPFGRACAKAQLKADGVIE